MVFRSADTDGVSKQARTLGLVACLILVALCFVHARLYTFLCDDAYISFRYVQNALHGHGLVFNPGQRVEGYTNFLWVLQLIGLGEVGIGPESGALVLSLVYALAALAAALAILRELTDKRDYVWAAPLLLVFLAASRTVAIWTTSGLETRSDTFFILLGIYGTLRAARRLPFGWLGPVGWAGACLTRPDSVMLFGLSTVALAIERRRLLPAIRFAIFPCVLVAMHFLWRRYYYGEWLPNTYYAKVNAPWWDAGGYYLAEAAVEYALWLVLPLALIPVWLARKRRMRRGVTFLLILTAAQAVYLARLGGDHFEYRLLDFCWFVWYASMIVGLAVLKKRFHGAPWKRTAAVGGIAAVVFAYGFALPAASGQATASWTTFHQAMPGAVQIAPGDLGLARFLPGMSPLRRLWNALSQDTQNFFVLRYEVHRLFAKNQFLNYDDFPIQGKKGGIIPRNTLVLISGGGIFSYVTGLPTIDRYGLTDKAIARNHQAYPAERHLAHYRLPPKGYLKKRGVKMMEPEVWYSIPTQYLGRKDFYVVKLPDGRFLTFYSIDKSWVNRVCKGLSIIAPSGGSAGK